MEGHKTLRQRIAGVHKALKKKVTTATAAAGKGEPSAAAAAKSVAAAGKRQLEASITRGALGDITNKDVVVRQEPSKKRSKKSSIPAAAASSSHAEEIVSAPVQASASHSTDQQMPEVKLDRGEMVTAVATSGDQVSKKQDECDSSSVTVEASLSSSSSSGGCDSSKQEVAASADRGDAVMASAASVDEDIWVDVDKECSTDSTQSPEYAADIFNYYKERELKFPIECYMPRQLHLTATMRAILVDWLVEVQENFELNHETLYTAVKLVDLYLAKSSASPIARESLQLVGAAAMFIGCKFDERIPPLVDDFLYICDDAYNRQEFVKMEKEILRTVDFDIGFPISYTFLRRYAKCARVGMETLTLARYMLELSLMQYELATEHRDSVLACAALWLAVRMKRLPISWDGTMRHYTGYNLGLVVPVAQKLNKMLHDFAAQSPEQASTLRTIRAKYSHDVFFNSAGVPLVDDSELLVSDPVAAARSKEIALA